ncbi:MAG: hypothetical protein PHC30_05305, partial [Lentisphaeria bacterium]|nr:hypothetical protein [Lentisphaeria bacterium]
MPPHETLFSQRTFAYWAALTGPRDAYGGGTYQWTAIPSDTVIISHAQMGEARIYPPRTIHDAWNLEEDIYFRLDDDAVEGGLLLRIEVVLPDGTTLHGEKEHRVENWTVPQFREDIVKRRRYCLARGLHWLQKRQRPTGGWTDRNWINYSQFQAYDDCYVDPPPSEPKTPANQHLFEQDDGLTLANTACALWAFGNCGFGLGDLHDNPFRGTVAAAIAYVMDRVHGLTLPAGGDDFDHNRNGAGVVFGEDQRFQGYVHPMTVAGLLAAGLPGLAVTVEGRSTVLAEVVEDACDTMASTLLTWGKGGWPYQYDVNVGFDQSIAGWHYLAMDAGQQWGITVSPRIYREYMGLLQRHFDDATAWFIYKCDSPSKTYSLAASGLTGLAMAAAADPEHDVFLPDGQTAATAGEMFVRTTHMLSLGIRGGGRRASGYFMWTIVRALQKLGIRNIFSYGTSVDWRYAAVPFQEGDNRAIWSKTIDMQQPDGRWRFNNRDFSFMDYSDELETAFMLLVLSDEVVRDTSLFSDLRVTTAIPAAVVSALVRNPFTEQVA